MIAVMKGHDECVGILLEGGADVDSQDVNGRTSLIWAVIMGHVNISGTSSNASHYEKI